MPFITLFWFYYQSLEKIVRKRKRCCCNGCRKWDTYDHLHLLFTFSSAGFGLGILAISSFRAFANVASVGVGATTIARILQQRITLIDV